MSATKQFFIYLFLLIACACNKKSKSFSETKSENPKGCMVTIALTKTSSYCGGARPPDELINELNTPKPFSGKMLCVKRGSQNKVDDTNIVFSGTTDSNGLLTMTLEPGTYYVVDEKKIDRKFANELLATYRKPSAQYSAIDVKCLEEWLLQPETTFTVATEKENKITLNLNEPCAWHAVPCVQYIGPLPP